MLSPDHVRELLTQRQINGWFEYYLRHPFGEYRSDLRNAMAIINARKCAGDKKRLSLDQFILKSGKKKTQQKPMTAAQLQKDFDLYTERRKQWQQKSSQIPSQF